MTPESDSNGPEDGSGGESTAASGSESTAASGGESTAASETSPSEAEPDETAIPEQGRQTGRPEHLEAAEEADWRSWVLVGVVIVCFLVVPGIILYIPEAEQFLASIGLSRRQAYLAFPMVPAIILGITAVWAAVRTQSPK